MHGITLNDNEHSEDECDSESACLTVTRAEAYSAFETALASQGDTDPAHLLLV